MRKMGLRIKPAFGLSVFKLGVFKLGGTHLYQVSEFLISAAQTSDFMSTRDTPNQDPYPTSAFSAQSMVFNH